VIGQSSNPDTNNNPNEVAKKKRPKIKGRLEIRK